MPSQIGKDTKGCFWKWGGSGKKYYFTCGNVQASKGAKTKADKQGAAAYSSGYTGESPTVIIPDAPKTIF